MSGCIIHGICSIREDDVLVRVALAVLVEQQTGEVGDGLTVRHGTNRIDHGGVGDALLPRGTDPKTHLLAVAATKAAKLEGRVVVCLIVLKQRGNPVAVLGHHVLVGRKVARSHDDGLAADVLDVVTIRIGGNYRAHTTGVAVVADKVAGDSLIVDGTSLLENLRLQGVHNVVLAQTSPRLDAVASLNPVVRAGLGGEGAVSVGVTDLHGCGVALAFHEVDHPVHGLGRLVYPAEPLLLVDLVATAGELAANHPDGGVFVVGGNAQALVHLGPDAVVGAAAGNGGGACGEQNYVGALFSSGGSADKARDAGTDDNGVGLIRGSDLALGHGLGCDLETP